MFNFRQRQQAARQGDVVATFTRSDDLQGAEFVDADLRGARFVGADLSGVVMRGVDMQGTDIDAPWLSNGENFLRVNGVDVIPFVEAELNRRFPGRADRRAGDRMVCARPGRRSSAPGRPRSSVSRRCRLARSTCRWAASGRSRRRCGTWSLPRTRGLAGRS
jgi:Pentapeptide repeats (8 copies)